MHQNGSSHKKQYNQDYYLQLAKKKKEVNLESLKLNRVISEGCANGNP